MAITPTIDRNGIHCPQFSEVLSYLEEQYRAIYGDDIYLGNDSQDGQFLGVLAKAINDSNAACVSAYNSFSPATAQGNGLSNMVKMNGIRRLIPTKSTVNLRIIGQAGAIIVNGAAQDKNNVYWDLPPKVVIPPEGEITVQGTCREFGAVTAPAGTIDAIATPTMGWQEVDNPVAAFAGAPLETDAALRQRQAFAVALPSLSVLAGTVGAVMSVKGVTEVAAYENDTDKTDGNGLPPHSIALVILGGDPNDIAKAIYSKKTAGAYTHGTTVVPIKDEEIGFQSIVRYFIPARKPVGVTVKIKPLINYTIEIGNQIREQVAAYINALKIGADVLTNRLYLPAQLYGKQGSETFDVLEITLNLKGAMLTDLPVGFNERATCSETDVVVQL